MSEESKQETALFVSDGRGGYYAIPRADLTYPFIPSTPPHRS